MNRFSPGLAALVLVILAQPASAQPKTLATFELDSPAAGTPVCIPLSVLPEFAKLTDVQLDVLGVGDDVKEPVTIAGQLTAPSLLTSSVPASDKLLVRRDLHLLAPAAKAKKLHITAYAKAADDKSARKFAWKTKPDDIAELFHGDQPVLRYVCKPYDNSTPENRDKTYKVFHHLYDPAGKRFITNGGNTNEPLGDPKKLLYPHHRGLMYAFNIITFDGKEKCDTWHAKPGDTHEAHAGFLSSEAGTVLGRHRVAIDWHGPKNQVFAKEEREITVYADPKGLLLDFASRLKTTGGKIKLDGDPQHAGFQFRAHNDVAVSTAKQTYYLRPDGKGKPGETRNWDPKTKMGPENLPWDAMCFVLDGKRYTVVYLNHPDDPRPSRWSERDYGRFGCYFEAEVTEKTPLVVHYRIWMQEGEMTQAQCEELHKAFAAPPKVTIK